MGGGALSRPERLVPPPGHGALVHVLWGICVYMDVCMCMRACMCTYICVLICMWMCVCVCECVFVHVHYNILCLLIVSVLWILAFGQRMVI